MQLLLNAYSHQEAIGTSPILNIFIWKVPLFVLSRKYENYDAYPQQKAVYGIETRLIDFSFPPPSLYNILTYTLYLDRRTFCISPMETFKFFSFKCLPEFWSSKFLGLVSKVELTHWEFLVMYNVCIMCTGCCSILLLLLICIFLLFCTSVLIRECKTLL